MDETYGEFVAVIYDYDLAKKNLKVFHKWLILKIDLRSYVKGPREDHIRAINGASDLLQSFYERSRKI